MDQEITDNLAYAKVMVKLRRLHGNGRKVLSDFEKKEIALLTKRVEDWEEKRFLPSIKKALGCLLSSPTFVFKNNHLNSDNV